MKTYHTDTAPAAIGPYSQAVSACKILFCSGQIPIDPATGNLKGETIEEQAEQSCKNVMELLKAAGVDASKVVKTTCFIANMSDFAKFNEVYAKYFISKPARSCVEAKLPKGALCEIEAIAEL
jgi:2-iminobutanoate/2-iminopropanoate deaminase